MHLPSVTFDPRIAQETTWLEPPSTNPEGKTVQSEAPIAIV